jgi:hypothetical protein
MQQERRLQSRKPPRWIERIVYYSVLPRDRKDQLRDLRRRYRRRLREKGQKSAMWLARREAAYWLCIMWPYRAYLVIRITMRVIGA